jgi:hypothetical protein
MKGLVAAAGLRTRLPDQRRMNSRLGQVGASQLGSILNHIVQTRITQRLASGCDGVVAGSPAADSQSAS